MARRKIANRRVIITGASSGIGASLARALVAEGAIVTLTARRNERVDALLYELNSDGAAEVAFILAGDITNADHRAALIQFATEKMGGLDTLVNNAGTGAIGPFLEADESRLRKIMEVNFFAVTELIRAATSALQATDDPVIVNIGSVLGHRAMPSKSEYCASKFAVHGFTDALRAELTGAEKPIDVILVSPSTTKSEFFDQLIENDGSSTKNPYGMTAEQVARKTISAIERGNYEVILSASGKLLVWLDRLSPRLAGWVARRFG